MRNSLLGRLRRDERGVAMVTVLLVTAVLTMLGLTVSQVAVSNLGNAGRDRVAAGALGAAEAGVTRAIGYINKHNTKVLDCSPSCSGNPWGNSTTPQTVSLPDGRAAKVWIKPIQKYQPPSYKVGIYKIYSVGTAGSGPGKRTLEVTVEVKPMGFPLGVFTKEALNNGGTGSVMNESVLSEACIDSRDKLNFSGIDSYYGVPAAAHSARYITTANVNGSCTNSLDVVKASDNKAIHRASVGTCNSTYPYDRDSAPLGGAFPSGSACTSAANQYTSSSHFDLTMLKAEPYNYLPRGLTDAQYALLKARAQASGTYYTTTSPATWPTATTHSNPVLYFKIGASDTVSIQGELSSYAWQSDPSCVNDHPTVVVVVEGGNLRLNSNASLAGAVFVPDGSMTYNGGAQLVGTLFAKQLNFTGNSSVSLNDCYTRATPGGVFDIKPTRFREVDR
ncbi:MAG TPA: hypothetical protein VNQ77_09860 [Frankiaceae bacterium]|nr:hypothetical protein [Frankiaceae bacterium]